MAETDPRYARAWLESLPTADSSESARELYQALYTLNRQQIKAAQRHELLMLYEPVIAKVCAGLHSHLDHHSAPLGPKRRQLAEFIRRLHVEMAYGYKLCLRDLRETRFLIGRRARLGGCIERALYHLSEVLYRSYVVYIPCPSGTWREIHELFRLAEGEQLAATIPSIGLAETAPLPIRERYLLTLLLGILNPYQWPQGMIQQAHALLAGCAHRATLSRTSYAADRVGRFLVDPDIDAPPTRLPTASVGVGREERRVLDTLELVRHLHGVLRLLEAGESVEATGLALECPDTHCREILRRLVRSYGLRARRRYLRRSQSAGSVLVCSGVSALYYFVNGQRAFTSPPWTRPDSVGNRGPSDGGAKPETKGLDRPPVESVTRALGRMRYERWQLRDVGPHGLSFSRFGDVVTPARVGDLLGVAEGKGVEQWQASVVRWIRSPETNSLEIGVEFLGRGLSAVGIRRVADPGEPEVEFRPGLLLPASSEPRRPPALILERGICKGARDLEILADGARRIVRPVRVIETTDAFELIAYAERKI